MKVDYVDHLGSDLTVVNAARVSFNKHKDKMDENDVKLLGYLARNGHWTPFSHPQITVRVKAPIFVARQLFKHKVGMTENEVSRRYVNDEPEFYYPDVWRGRPTDGAKQGSSDSVIEDMTFRGNVEAWSGPVDMFYCSLIEASLQTYTGMINAGIAPEQARMVLPQSMYTEWIWTGSLASFARIYKLRSDPHTQMETQEIAKMIDTIIRPLYPEAWKALAYD